MDSLTHIAIGACLGEVFAGKKLGKKALLWGALTQSIPDIDFIATFWTSTSENLLAHRGFTHSFLFAILITPLLAMTAEKWHRPHNISLHKWILFFGAQIGVRVHGEGYEGGVGAIGTVAHHQPVVACSIHAGRIGHGGAIERPRPCEPRCRIRVHQIERGTGANGSDLVRTQRRRWVEGERGRGRGCAAGSVR